MMNGEDSGLGFWVSRRDFNDFHSEALPAPHLLFYRIPDQINACFSLVEYSIDPARPAIGQRQRYPSVEQLFPAHAGLRSICTKLSQWVTFWSSNRMFRIVRTIK